MAKATAQQGLKEWGIYVLLIIVSLSATFFGIQWQQTEDEVANLAEKVAVIDEDTEKEIEQLEIQFRQEIARLDESNRTRRNDIADLEERIARLEERVDYLEADS